MAGGRIGKDGIHGATFSSEELHEARRRRPCRSADPITQKKMLDMLLEARDMGLYRCITDNGAGGLSSSVGETAESSGGCETGPGQSPAEVLRPRPLGNPLIRGAGAHDAGGAARKDRRVHGLMQAQGVEATVLGTFTSTGKFHILYDGKTVAYLDMDFLHHGLPKMSLTAKWKAPKHKEPELPRRA